MKFYEVEKLADSSGSSEVKVKVPDSRVCKVKKERAAVVLGRQFHL